MNNSTAAPNGLGSEAAAASTNTFSRANIFGIFITLQICQLTQPYGSLLYREAGGWLWRCNPVASCLEACIIFWSSRQPLWACFRSITISLHRRRRSWWTGSRVDEPAERALYSYWKTDLYNHAAALLLLRGVDEKHDGAVMQKLLAASLNLQNRESESEQDDSGQNNVQSGVTRRSTKQLKAGVVSSQTGFSSTPVPIGTLRTQLLQEAFGSNALAHKEKRIDIVTATAVVLILVKLLAINQAPLFTAYALMTTSGWAALQALLLLLHAREMTETDMQESVKTARALRSDLGKYEDTWSGVHFIVHLPLFGYFTYRLAFHFTFPSWLQWLGTFLQECACFLSFYLAIIVLVGALICVLILICMTISAPILLLRSILRLYRGQVDRIGFATGVICSIFSWILCLLAIILSGWFGLGSWIYYFKHQENLGGPHLSLVFESPILIHVFVDYFNILVLGCWTYVIFSFFLTMFKEFVSLPQYNFGKYGEAQGDLISVGSIATTLGIFLWYLLTYDDTGTTKPAWVEWLG